MRTWVKIIGGIAVVVASFVGTNWALDRWWPVSPCQSAERVELKRPFQNIGGHTFLAKDEKFNSVSDTNEQQLRSNITLCEDDRLLGPNHSAVDDVTRLGGGKFSHWISGFFFSSSDNSNPNTNGRRYSVGP